MPKQAKESRDTKKVLARLQKEGWKIRPGKGDHVNLSKEGCQELITIDAGQKVVKRGIYENIKRKAGWK